MVDLGLYKSHPEIGGGGGGGEGHCFVGGGGGEGATRRGLKYAPEFDPGESPGGWAPSFTRKPNGQRSRR